MSDLPLLQTLRVKGRSDTAKLAAALGTPATETESRCDELVDAGLCEDTRAGLKLSEAGVERLTELLDEERAIVDAEELTRLYAEFLELDVELKKILTAWQLTEGGTPNDHGDFAYDRRVLRRLATLHARANEWLGRVGRSLPRLSRYGERLVGARQRIDAGDHDFVAGALVDSYHTVWFELHEDLLGLTGARREA